MPSPSSATEELAYGSDEDQQVSFGWPDSGRVPRGVVALIHGGYWRSRYDASLMDPLAGSLRENGWMTANIEYRRGRSNPWPAPLVDIRAALVLVRDYARAKSVGGPRISVGHSVGGQLALLTAELTDGVVALAPVTDVGRTYREKLGEDAALEYFGASPELAPSLYREASPTQQPLSDTPLLILHGINDDRVPISHSRDFMAVAQPQVSRAELIEYEQLSHRDAIDPAAVHWSDALTWIAAITAS
ncbi:alpha/beta fold hydrolase [Nakamurella antarctica]|uniref:alpha/beta fold hydrolase n=1 Tax=Nakamurella antarctica TaxID=1902245 RepID=UPI0013DDCB5F|nr:alpha/beta fold hydrolase [Nakamurella antarctica]